MIKIIRNHIQNFRTARPIWYIVCYICDTPGKVLRYGYNIDNAVTIFWVFWKIQNLRQHFL